MGGGGVVDVGDVHQVTPVADADQPPATRAVHDARHQMRIARTPDQVRAKCDGEEFTVFRTVRPVHGCSIRGQHLPFGNRLRFRVVRQERGRIRQRFVAVFDAAVGHDDARRTGVDEPPHPGRAAASDDVSRADDVDLEVGVAPAPDAGDRGDVNDGVHPVAGRRHGCSIADVGADAADSERRHVRIVAAAEDRDVVSPGQQHARDRPAEKPAAAGHQGLHRSPTRPAAHTASFSRKIFALWRMSTGKLR